PRPESLGYADCFMGEFKAVLDFKPGLFGPSQVMFRNENEDYPDHVDLNAYYRKHIFPAKARVDLAYYSSRTTLGDLKWLLHSIAATLNLVNPAPAALENQPMVNVTTAKGTPKNRQSVKALGTETRIDEI
ncbi:MAG: sugar transferase, partial [Hyphomicrobiaceae bacterium]